MVFCSQQYLTPLSPEKHPAIKERLSDKKFFQHYWEHVLTRNPPTSSFYRPQARVLVSRIWCAMPPGAQCFLGSLRGGSHGFLGELPICRSLRRSPKKLLQCRKPITISGNPEFTPVHDWGANSWTEVGVFQFVQAGTKSETTVGGIIIIEFNEYPPQCHLSRGNKALLRIIKGPWCGWPYPFVSKPVSTLPIFFPWRSSCSAKCDSPGFTFQVWLSRTDKSIPEGWNVVKRGNPVQTNTKNSTWIKQTHGNTGFLHTTQSSSPPTCSCNKDVSILQGAVSCSH